MNTGVLIGIIGIIATVVFGVAAFFVITKRNTVNIKQKSKHGNSSIDNSIIGSVINTSKKDN